MHEKQLQTTKTKSLIQSPLNTATMSKGSGLTKPLNLSPELAHLARAKKGEKLSRSKIVKGLWAYIKEPKLQDPENKQYFKPDKKMQPIIGSDNVRAFGMAKFLETHLPYPTNSPPGYSSLTFPPRLYIYR